MGLHVVVEAESPEQVRLALGDVASSSEVFSVGARYGISIPMNVVDDVGEAEVRRRLSLLKHYDLYDGKWKTPSKGWKFW
jgi:hypothetical protein